MAAKRRRRFIYSLVGRLPRGEAIALLYLTGIAVILILGILATILARRVRTSNILFLLLIGLSIGNTKLSEIAIFQPAPDLVIGIAIFTLALVVFDGSSRFTWHDLDKLSLSALELTISWMAFNILLVMIVMNIFYFGFTAQGILLGIILGIALSGTDPASVFILLGDSTHRVLQFLKVEALINTPIIVLLPFLLIDLLSELNAGVAVFNTFIDFIGPFLLQLIVGIGTGVLVGAIIFKVMRRWYSENLSPVAIISATLLTYILAENLGGNGVLAVAVLGLLFGNTYVRQKGSLKEFSSLLSYSLEILVFILLGTMIKLPTDKMFWMVSVIILVAVLFSRYVAQRFMAKEHTHREHVFMALNMPKGIALAVVALTLLMSQVEGLTLIVNMMIAMTIYTIILSSIADHFAKWFLKRQPAPDAEQVTPAKPTEKKEATKETPKPQHKSKKKK